MQNYISVPGFCVGKDGGLGLFDQLRTDPASQIDINENQLIKPFPLQVSILQNALLRNSCLNIVGHSLGCFVTLQAIADRKQFASSDANEIILLCPPLDLNAFKYYIDNIARFCSNSGFEVDRGFIESLSIFSGDPTEYFLNMVEIVNNLGFRITVIQGEKDRFYVPELSNLLLERGLENVISKSIPNLDHSLLSREISPLEARQAVINELNFPARQLQRVQTGFEEMHLAVMV
jgi:pimeloyl-ACP methyl ester carboxylesterase